MTSQTNDPQHPVEHTEPEVNPNGKRNNLLLKITIGIVVAGLIWLLLWLLYFQYYESTDDAYANGYLINVNPIVPGSVTAFYADDTVYVQKGQLLVELDKTPYQIAYDQELANLQKEILEVKRLYDSVLSHKADVESKRIGLSQAQYDYRNREPLVNSLAISGEDFTHSQNSLLIAEAQLRQAEHQLKEAQDLAGNTPWQTHPRIEAQKTKVRKAYYDLAHCSIYSPATGYVAQRAVEVGQSVRRESNLLAIIPADGLWVDANFKETQLTYMRVGQPVTVTFDLYGSDIKFQGKVLGIASGTGSVFSLLPPQNATGNWIKIVQRLPVRVSLLPEEVKKYPIRLGLSAYVSVDISQTQLPMLAPPMKQEPVMTTPIFELNFTEAERAIEQAIQDEES